MNSYIIIYYAQVKTLFIKLLKKIFNVNIIYILEIHLSRTTNEKGESRRFGLERWKTYHIERETAAEI